jgi:hypothetical protein
MEVVETDSEASKVEGAESVDVEGMEFVETDSEASNVAQCAREEQRKLSRGVRVLAQFEAEVRGRGRRGRGRGKHPGVVKQCRSSGWVALLRNDVSDGAQVVLDVEGMLEAQSGGAKFDATKFESKFHELFEVQRTARRKKKKLECLKFEGAKVVESTPPPKNAENASKSAKKSEGAKFPGTKSEGAKFDEGTKFEGLKFDEGTKFEGAKFDEGLKFVGTKFEGAKFDEFVPDSPTPFRMADDDSPMADDDYDSETADGQRQFVV